MERNKLWIPCLCLWLTHSAVGKPVEDLRKTPWGAQSPFLLVAKLVGELALWKPRQSSWHRAMCTLYYTSVSFSWHSLSCPRPWDVGSMCWEAPFTQWVRYQGTLSPGSTPGNGVNQRKIVPNHMQITNPETITQWDVSKWWWIPWLWYQSEQLEVAGD